MRLTKAIRTNKKSNLAVRAEALIDTYPAPTRGWNARDPLGGMKANDAIVLDNYFPTTADVRLRGGSNPWSTGMGAGKPVETLMVYRNGSTSEMWSAVNGKIYNSTAAGAVGPAAVSGQLSNRWQNTIFQTSAAIPRLVCVNGLDDMRQYDGTTWHQINAASAPIAITGVATANLINVWVFKNRLFFIEKNKMDAWYLPVDSYGGAAVKLPLGGIFKRGGYLIAGGTWTRDGGDGEDDLCVFVTSQGEVAIFHGNDPSTAPTNWGLIGRYDVGSPIGYRCLIRTGADLAIICLDGILGLSNVITLDRAASNKVALSNRIQGAFSEATKLYKDHFGWEALSYPAGSFVIFNIPFSESAQQVQFVLNALTGAWCRFTELNANCWCLFNERIYFGNNNGQVWLADDGDSDNNAEIAGLVKTAFIYHRGNARKKTYKMAKPIIYSDVSLPYGIALAVDFDQTVLAPSTSGGVSSGSTFWDTSPWDTTPWATLVALKSWRKINGVGTCGSIIFKTNTKGYPVTLNSIDIMFEVGGPL